MTAYDQADKDVLSMPYKKHGPGGYLPVIATVETNQPRANKTRKQEKHNTKKTDESWAPVPAKPNPVHVLAKCAYIGVVHAAIEMVLFYWGLVNLMDYQTSWGASVVVAVIGGFRIGFTLKQNY